MGGETTFFLKEIIMFFSKDSLIAAEPQFALPWVVKNSLLADARKEFFTP